ncbi:hypothetical protein [Engelhardtia mirabilis]|uniref:Uncharacterized protein n=1 Tax=Engelhardtia mirabilis TaxID=2528011 RepID=A0A518BQP9_9BACT|nr:hypothetical protein Pla133_44140 [Planctomycetes bacterium Pla133]QDV03621.1 hypothetical protein Pla86_44120 [Planctomycetes bacterium Pla86]
MSETKTATDNQDWHPQLENDVQGGRAFPVWIWGCGGGCLIVLMLFIGGSVWFGNKMFSTFGPEAAWPVISEVMPFGAVRPEGYEPLKVEPRLITGMMRRIPGMDDKELDKVPDMQLLIINRPGDSSGKSDLTAMLYRLPVGATQKEKLEFLHEPANSPGEGEVEVSEGEQLEVTLQGRKLKALRFAADSTGPVNPFMSGESVEVLQVDLSGERARPLLLHLSSNKAGVVLDEAALQDFFAPFDVWGGK